MGGNTFFRKYFTDEELLLLVKKAVEQPLVSLRSDRKFDTERQWRADVPRLLDKDSSKRFYFFLATYHSSFNCAWCDSVLGIESFYGGIVGTGFNKFCASCVNDHVFSKKENFTEEQLLAKGSKITKSKLLFYQTDEGKETAKTIGKKNAIRMKEFVKTNQGKLNIENSRKFNSELMTEKILRGEFTPKTNNRNTHWDSYLNGVCYRSSWEAYYHYLYPNLEYEKLRIPYVDVTGKEKVYIVDFVDHDRNIVVEIKPSGLTKKQNELLKIDALKEWAKINEYSVLIISEYELFNKPLPDDLTMFDENTQRKLKKSYYANTKN